MQVTLVERGEFTSGTTGRHHGLLHSGARYAVNDQESAVECIEENTLLRRSRRARSRRTTACSWRSPTRTWRTCPTFLEGCERTGIPTQELQPDEALRLEPMLNPELKVAVRVPDATMDAMRMPLRFFATAKANGADLLNYVDVIDLEPRRRDRLGRARPRPRDRARDARSAPTSS